MSGNRCRKLKPAEIEVLQAQGCTAKDWGKVKVADPFRKACIKNTHFSGDVSIGKLGKKMRLFGGVEKKAGLYNVTIHNCMLGDNVFISNVENYIANYDIDDDVVIEHVSLLAVQGQSCFGNGTEVVVINEVGGREIPIYDNLSAHAAYVIALYRDDTVLVEKLKKMIDKYVSSVRSSRGLIGKNSRIIDCSTMKNVKIGPCAVLEGVSLLENGSINSCVEDPSFIGTNVIARDFILCSGARVSENSIISKCFVGQGSELARQYSAENSVFFANCGGYHGEACSVFAGPYTVTHHKSTLLISGLFSFLNAGSGSNQSNHMYKLGPLHQGVVERGSKTTSDSYMLWPARVGAFTLVMGRHYGNFDTSEIPFSYLIEYEDASYLVPGVNLRSVGTVRDARKWPGRDRRKSPNKFDHIVFNLLTPYTVQKIMNGVRILEELKESPNRKNETYHYKGVRIRSSSLERGIDFYKLAIERYLGNTLVNKLKENSFKNEKQLQKLLTVKGRTGRGEWIDLAGLIAPKKVLQKVLADIRNGRISSLAVLDRHLLKIYHNFAEYEWVWVAKVLEQRFKKTLDQLTCWDIKSLIEGWIQAVEKLDNMRIADALKEFDSTARTGYGIDGNLEIRDADFEAIRGGSENNSFIVELKRRLRKKKKTAKVLINKLGKIK